MSHAPCGKRFSDRSKEKRLGACMPEGGVSDPPDENQSRLADFLIC